MAFVVGAISIPGLSCKRCPSGPESEPECRFVFIPHDTPPRPKEYVVPEYPEEAKEAGIQGVVVLLMYIDQGGNVRIVCVAKSVHPLLDEAALEAARKWTFFPALRNNKPIGVWVFYPIYFRLED
ncbi:hypothetical protein AMJ40_04170 [candidate division TA06 bacterium DG_26]|uniref:TonB C-terminal domain-containing protein n=1 Tax=candidate division TA06 bacterium DG_26 TaxID=1703771 RepID=A0A0S7WIK6_UNCT6|nr:MAG: hypothetical protein AMJ40_04170 [candidate division TA06 bacterium DG_26]